MTPAPAPAGSRLLAACWRELAGWQPLRVWHATLLIHQVEALFAIARPVPLDSLHRSLLLALAPSAPPTALDSLHLDPQLQGACLRELSVTGLIQKTAPPHHELTPAGHRALASGQGSSMERRRRVLSFLDNSSLGRPPHFLHLDLPPGREADTAAGQSFDPGHLHHAIAASAEWKALHHFPPEILAICGVNPGDAPSDWRRVIMARPEQHHFVLAEAPDKKHDTVLCGFLLDHVTQHCWVDRPAFRLEGGRQEVFPDLTMEPSAQAWRQGFEAWCQSLPQFDPALLACDVEYAQAKLLVRATPAISAGLRALPGDPLSHGGWVQAQQGRLTWSARIQLT